MVALNLCRGRRSRAFAKKWLIVLKIIFPAMVVLYLYFSGYIGKGYSYFINLVNNAAIQAGFVVKNVYLEGQVNTDSDDLKKTLGFNIGDNILIINMKELHARLASLPWVKNIVIVRQLPSIIHIHITEKEAVALWQYNRRVHIIDIDGNIIPDSNTIRFRHLPLIIGESANLYVDDLLRTIGYDNGLFEHVKVVNRISERRWNITLKNGTVIRLPELDYGKAWHNVISKVDFDSLISGKYEYIDLKVKGKIYIKPR